MNTERPNTELILSRLKDFQRDTVDYVFRRLYLDPDCVRRFLVADEVGLGKTLVARGLIAQTIDYLWEKTQRIDIVYVCSNTDIARQNINRLNVTSHQDFTLSSRITLLPVTLNNMQQRRINFVSFTPGTSFDLKGSGGRSEERELLYWLLKEPWGLDVTRATRVLHGNTKIEGFRDRVKSFDQSQIQSEIQDQFGQQLALYPELKERFDELCQVLPRAGYEVPKDLLLARNQLVGELRNLLAKTCLHWLEPDLIILDEFQRFKDLLKSEGEEASDAALLAQHLFNYQQSQDDPSTAARVVLLSATPYKMYTQRHEVATDDHYQDFRSTLDFLLPDISQRDPVYKEIQQYREQLLRLAEGNTDSLRLAKAALENSLRKVLVRTERLAISADRNGMLREIPADITLSANDLEQYLAVQRIAKELGHKDVLEYWKSAPYLLNFMEDYELKRDFHQVFDEAIQEVSLVRAVQSAEKGMLSREQLEKYRRLDPGNARLRSILRDTVDRGAWRLLWIPPAMPYYQGAKPFDDPQLEGFTKRLVFSCWRVVPKAIAAVLSYEAERRMTTVFRKAARNTADARKKRRALLRFAYTKGEARGMPVLGMIYPCVTLSRRFDPLRIAQQTAEGTTPPPLEDVLQRISQGITELLPSLEPYLSAETGAADERWYWAAPLLLDSVFEKQSTSHWFGKDTLAELWDSGVSEDESAATGWQRHLEIARQVVAGTVMLGPQPPDLAHRLACLTIAGPGITAWRALNRISDFDPSNEKDDLRDYASPLAHAFLHLFNLPEVMTLIRDRRGEVPYWQSVLEYCAAGNLQAVLDEYAHMLVESLGLLGNSWAEIANSVSESIQNSLTLRTSTAQADLIRASRRRILPPEQIRIRTRFAMRFGDQDGEDSSEPTRADHVRAAFNSPFWPFVLATTSVGQEGLDFHPYCHAVVHWNLPSNPVDLEQREGRVHRYKGHALRKNIAAQFGKESSNGVADPWFAMFEAAIKSRDQNENDLYPFWISPFGQAKIERHVLSIPHSRDVIQHANLLRSLVLYRMVFGQNRQEDLMEYLLKHIPEESLQDMVELCRIELSPPCSNGPARGSEGF